ncbi:MAG: glycosyltransferase family 1 protein, partial [Methanotrichaceae archaeon]|nr:glycosyltransferase family 1 protein [Methanotrichaceae archaeon]
VTVKHRMNAVMDLVRKDTGVVCQPTPQNLAEAVSKTLQNAGRMRGRCIEEAGRYDWEEICSRAERVYDDKSDHLEFR